MTESRGGSAALSDPQLQALRGTLLLQHQLQNQLLMHAWRAAATATVTAQGRMECAYHYTTRDCMAQSCMHMYRHDIARAPDVDV